MQKAVFLIFLIFLSSCSKDNIKSHASGVFETEDIIVSALSIGEILEFNIEEGKVLKKDEVVGKIDSKQLLLQKQQLEVAITTLENKIVNVDNQIAPLKEEVEKYEKEVVRFQNLVKSGAANRKQLDDIKSAYNSTSKKYSATLENLEQNNKVIENEIANLKIQIDMVEDNIEKSNIKAPIDGTVLTKYANAFEFSQIGKPLFKMADISTLILRAYVTSDILTQVKLGDTPLILADFGKNDIRQYQGKIIWISDKAEFTPKTIPSRNERSNLVYAVKIQVENDGYLRKGMYGEVVFSGIKE